MIVRSLWRTGYRRSCELATEWASSMPKPVRSTSGSLSGTSSTRGRGRRGGRHLEDKDAAVAEREAGGEVQVLDEILALTNRPSGPGSSRMVMRSAPFGPRGGGSGTRS